MSPVSQTLVLDLINTNDYWVSAEQIEGVSGLVVGTLAGATAEPGEFFMFSRYESEDPSVWYKWVAPISGDFFFQAEGLTGEDLNIAIFRGNTSASNGFVVGAGDDLTHTNRTPRAAVHVTAGIQYFVRVGSWGDEGGFHLIWGMTTVPKNCLFAKAAELKAQGDFTGSNFDALTEEGLFYNDSVGLDTAWPAVWYTYLNRSEKPVIFNMSVTAVDPDLEMAMEIWKTPDGTIESLDFLVYVNPGTVSKQVVEPGERIYICVLDDWFQGGMGEFTYNFHTSPLPYEDVPIVVTAYDPTDASLTSTSSKYSILGVKQDGMLVDIYKNSEATPHHALAAVMTRVGNLWYIDQEHHDKDLVNWGDSMWRYQEGALGIANGAEAKDFDDSSWAVGRTPFGPTGFSVIGFTPKTIVPTAASRDLFMRTKITGPGLLTLSLAYDDSVQVWVDGAEIYYNLGINHAATYSPPSFAYTTLSDGDHILAVRRRDNGGGANWFDASWSITPTATSISPSRHYRTRKVVDGEDVSAADHAINSEWTAFTPKLIHDPTSIYRVWNSYVAVGDGTNMLPPGAGSFEGGSVSEWESWLPGNTLIDAVTTQAAHGNYSMRMRPSPSLYPSAGPDPTRANINAITTDFIPVFTMDRPLNSRYTAWAEFRWNNFTPSANATVSVQVQFYDKDFNHLFGQLAGLWSWIAYTNGTTAWNQSQGGSDFEWAVVNPATRYVKFLVGAGDVPAGAEIFVDKIGLIPEPYYNPSSWSNNAWRRWTPEGKLDNAHQYRSGFRDPESYGAGLGGARYAKSFAWGNQTDEYELAQAAGLNLDPDNPDPNSDCDLYGIYPDDPQTEVALHTMQFGDDQKHILYANDGDEITGTLAEYLTSIHNGTGYPYLKTGRDPVDKVTSGPGEDLRLHYMENNGNLFFAVRLANCVYDSVAFEIKTNGEFVAAYPDTKMALYAFTAQGAPRRPHMAGTGAYSCPDPDGKFFWVIDYDSNGPRIWKVPFAEAEPVGPISTLGKGYKVTSIAALNKDYGYDGCNVEGWWNCNYIYRRVLQITASDGLSNGHPVKAVLLKTDTLQQGKIRPDHQDIEVLHWDGTLYQLLEFKLTETSDSYIIEFPLYEAMADNAVSLDEYYIYYGNPEMVHPDTHNEVFTPDPWPDSIPFTDITVTRPGEDWTIGPEMRSSTPNAKATVVFTGSKIQLLVNTGRAYGAISVSLDDGPEEHIDLFSLENNTKAVFTRTELTDEQHTLRIVVSDDKKHTVSITGVNYHKTATAVDMAEEIIPLRWTNSVGGQR